MDNLAEVLDEIKAQLAEVKADNTVIKRTLESGEFSHRSAGYGLGDHTYSSRVTNHESSASNTRVDDHEGRVEGHEEGNDNIDSDIYNRIRPRRVAEARSLPDLDDIQQEFSIIKDSVQRVRLPKDLKVDDSRQGVRRADQGRMNNISKCARYAETSLKLLANLSADRVSEEDINDLLIVNVALVRYLQEEHALVHVNGSFGDNVEKIYRNFRRNTSVFNSQAIESLQAAVTLDAAHPSNSGYSGNYRGNYRGRWPNSGYRGRGFRGGSVYRFNRNVNGNQFNNSPPQGRGDSTPLNNENNF